MMCSMLLSNDGTSFALYPFASLARRAVCAVLEVQTKRFSPQGSRRRGVYQLERAYSVRAEFIWRMKSGSEERSSWGAMRMREEENLAGRAP